MKKTIDHTIKDAFEYYLTAIQLAPNTKSNYENTKNKLETAGLLDLPLHALTPATFRKFLNNMVAMQSTIHGCYTQTKTVLNRYVQDHALPLSLKSLNGIIKKPKVKETVIGEEEYLTFTELKELLAHDLADEPRQELARDLFALMCLTGMAVGDLLKFTTDCVVKKQDGTQWVQYKRNKTGKVCPIPMLQLTQALIFKENMHWPLGISKRTIQSWCETTITNLVGKRMTAHSARHSFGVIMLELGFSMESVSKLMGHSSILITSQVYAKVTMDKIDREMKQIPKELREMMKV